MILKQLKPYISFWHINNIMIKVKPATFYSICVVSTICVLSLSPMVSFSNTEFQNNTTTICQNGNCTITMCINDEPCKTTNSNSTNITSLGDLAKNKTIVTPNLPSEVV